MIQELDQIVKDGERILRTTRPAVRQKNWRAWCKKIAALLDDAAEGRDLPVQLKPDTLADDVRALKDYVQRGDETAVAPKREEDQPESDLQTAPAQDLESFGVFISHRGKNDQEVASTIRDKLRILSHSKIDSFLFEEIRGGDDWYQWVEDNVYRSKVLLLIYTDDEMDLQWCLYEAGLYRGFRRDKDLHLICLKNANIPNPPRPLQRFQSYNADEEGIENFLKDMLYRGSFSGGEQINPGLLDEDEQEFNRAVKDIRFLFEERQINRDYFRKRLEVHIPDSDSRDDAEERSESSASVPIDISYLDSAEVDAGELTRDLLNLPANTVLKWKDVSAQLSDRGHRWVHEVREAVQAVEGNRSLRQVLSSFDSTAGRICIPLLSRVERVRNRPKLLSVIFVESEVLEKAGEIDESLTRAPEPLMTIVHLLNLARRFRWNIIEHFIAKLSHPDTQGQSLRAVLGDLAESLTRLEKEAEDHGYLQLEAIAVSLPDTPRETIRGLFESFYADREPLMNAIAEHNKEQAISLLESMRRINKKFLILALSEYTKKIAYLEPTDIQDLSDAQKV